MLKLLSFSDKNTYYSYIFLIFEFQQKQCTYIHFLHKECKQNIDPVEIINISKEYFNFILFIMFFYTVNCQKRFD